MVVEMVFGGRHANPGVTRTGTLAGVGMHFKTVQMPRGWSRVSAM
jgi:hypothetical protein